MPTYEVLNYELKYAFHHHSSYKTALVAAQEYCATNIDKLDFFVRPNDIEGTALAVKKTGYPFLSFTKLEDETIWPEFPNWYKRFLPAFLDNWTCQKDGKKFDISDLRMRPPASIIKAEGLAASIADFYKNAPFELALQIDEKIIILGRYKTLEIAQGEVPRFAGLSNAELEEIHKEGR